MWGNFVAVDTRVERYLRYLVLGLSKWDIEICKSRPECANLRITLETLGVEEGNHVKNVMKRGRELRVLSSFFNGSNPPLLKREASSGDLNVFGGLLSNASKKLKTSSSIYLS